MPHWEQYICEPMGCPLLDELWCRIIYWLIYLFLYLLQQVGLAKEFESLVRADKRFEICAPVVMGLVCFRLKVSAHSLHFSMFHSPSRFVSDPITSHNAEASPVFSETKVIYLKCNLIYLFNWFMSYFSTFSQGSNELNQSLLKKITKSREIHLVPCQLSGSFVLRLAICSRSTESRHIQQAWQHITQLAFELLQEHRHWQKSLFGSLQTEPQFWQVCEACRFTKLYGKFNEHSVHCWVQSYFGILKLIN